MYIKLRHYNCVHFLYYCRMYVVVWKHFGFPHLVAIFSRITNYRILVVLIPCESVTWLKLIINRIVCVRTTIQLK
jgi:hypothetical protein